MKPVYDKKIAEELADCDAAELQAMLEIIHTTNDKELLLKLLQNPEMAALLKSLAKTL